MTRELTVAERFEHGTLIEAKPHSAFADRGFAHAYYVPDEARKNAGMEKVARIESSEEFFKESGAPDFEAIESLVSAADIVERAETEVLNCTDGDIGTERRSSARFRLWSDRTSDEEPSIPAGVVKFSNPDADDENSVHRDPLERGYCWGVLQDQVLPRARVQRLQYQNEVRRASPAEARVPLSVVGEGEEAIVAYLVAHDHAANLVGPFLGLEPESVRTIVKGLVKAD